MANRHGDDTLFHLQLDAASDPPVYTVLGSMEELTLPSVSVTVTEHTVYGNNVPIKIGSSILNVGDIKFKLLYDVSNTLHSFTDAVSLGGALKDGIKREFKIVLPEGTDGATGSYTGQALVTMWNRAAPIRNAVTIDVTLSVTSELTVDGIVLQ